MHSDGSVRVDLKRMRMVVEVARAAAITTAAETLGLTQSAVSRGVAEIEAALGVRLFDRLPRGIKPTDAGERFIARARRVLSEMDDLVTEVREDTDRVAGRLRNWLDLVGRGSHLGLWPVRPPAPGCRHRDERGYGAVALSKAP